jgi:hypothetical protein
MKNLEKRGERFARARQDIAIGIVAARLIEQLRGVRVEVEQNKIRISGSGLFKRWLTETQLRFVADLLK